MTRRFLPMPTLAVPLVALLAACGQPAHEAPTSEAPTTSTPTATTPQPASSTAIFVDEAAQRGLDFVHWNGMTGDWVYSEHMGGGIALFDYDNDGDLDVYATQGHLLGDAKTPGDALFPAPEGDAVDRLYRNELEPGNPASLRFVDVTEEAGLVADGYSMGVATGDIDNDGFPDLYVTEWEGGNRLLRNRGDGTFEDITVSAGVADPRWSVAAAFFDADGDGLLDLYVGN